jgi:glycosyltransferase involved in cell wall biosynthesis
MKVSVLMITYNHEKFVARAIDSILMQKVDFDYEVVIGEDCSTDNTREIVLGYKEEFPNKIRLLLNQKNLGGRKNLIQTFKACKGEYIAMLEGDDYWTSPHKLQKQVDFLDTHPECAICFHNVMVIYEDSPEISHPFYVQNPNGPFMKGKPKPISNLEDLLKGNFIQTPSVMFRAPPFDEFPNWFYFTPMGDWSIHILNAQHGKIGYIDEIMGIYRIHDGGVWSSKGLIPKLQREIETYRFFNAHFNFRYNKFIKSKISLRYLWIAVAYKRSGDRIKALANLFKYISKFPCNEGISFRRLLLMILELSLPVFYKTLMGLKYKFLS